MRNLNLCRMKLKFYSVLHRQGFLFHSEKSQKTLINFLKLFAYFELIYYSHLDPSNVTVKGLGGVTSDIVRETCFVLGL